jgi:hypothetical protein
MRTTLNWVSEGTVLASASGVWDWMQLKIEAIETDSTGKSPAEFVANNHGDPSPSCSGTSESA